MSNKLVFSIGILALFLVQSIYSKKLDISSANEIKITGGTLARRREFPYVVSIRTYDYDGLGHFCGGSIISPTMVLTAGACTDPRSPKIDEIVAGTMYRNETSNEQQMRRVERIVAHPNYTFPPYDDISIIFLNEPFEFNNEVSAIKLPEREQETYPFPVTVPGWGSPQYGEPMSDYLEKVTVDTYSDAECEEFMGQPVVGRHLLCGGTNEGGLSACIGDAGAPVVSTSGQIYIAGVLSHFGCTDPLCCGFPGPMDHNPEVAFYIDWILEQSNLYGGGL